jgi:CRP-like cAMP-binding protein
MKKSFIFGYFSDIMMKTIISYFQPITFKMGEYIKRSDEKLDQVYILFSGYCKIVLEYHDQFKIKTFPKNNEKNKL